jgi:hypothetical protein
MALDTYANLKTAVANRMDRSDIATYVTDWITIAEKDIMRWLRTSWVEGRAYATPTSAFISLPSDYNGLRNIQWDYSNYRLNLEQVSPDMLDKISPSTTVGIPTHFAIHDNQIELRPAPSGDNTTTVRISYYFIPTVLSDANTSNEILVNAPDLLFFRTLAEGHDFFFDEARAAKYMSMYEKIKADIINDDKRTIWGDAPMRVQADSLRQF